MYNVTIKKRLFRKLNNPFFNKLFKVFLALIFVLVFTSCSNKEYIIKYYDNENNLLKQVITTTSDFQDLEPVCDIEGYYYEFDYSDIMDYNKYSLNATLKEKTYLCKFYYNNVLVEEKSLSFSSSKECSIYIDTLRYIIINSYKEERIVDKTTVAYNSYTNYELKKYNVKFVSINDNVVIYEENVLYGESVVFPYLDKYEVIDEVDYSNIKDDLVINVKKKVITRNIKYYDDNKLLSLSPNNYIEGESSFTLPAYSKDGYEFIGWFLSSISLTKYIKIDPNTKGDLTLYARFIKIDETITLPKATYTFTGIKKIKHSTAKDIYVYQPILPLDCPSQSVLQYDFASSNTNICTIFEYSSISCKNFGFSVITATYKQNKDITINMIVKVTSEGVFASNIIEANETKLCKITFALSDGTIIDTSYCKAGGSVVYPYPKDIEGMKFIGWSHENYNIKDDITIIANYERGCNKYQGKTISIIGDSISTYSSLIPNNFQSFYPYPTCNVNDYNQTWWMMTINKLGGSLFTNNSYSGTCVSNTSSNDTCNIQRLRNTLINKIAPDVIMIYMGSNDCASKYVSIESFDAGYKQMLRNLKSLCPNSEIILISLANTGFYTFNDMKDYNRIIKKYAIEYNLVYIDMENCDISNMLVDSAHPTKKGMEMLSEELYKKLLEE